ncbi:hypothetical protein NKK52_31715 [Mesorhizobium sp. C277A]|uniref:Uncharacterized protein n=1 Tax=Mesorhizobium caraganae TaxID=483206 RepID=A0ABV1Z840_9HYPH|nr:hypothetical protein [Mesorhizobium sp. LSJC277A00]ESW62866.1 hypothetical protein X771_32115 [Mesorhizobium sp. LSJC277A00]
MKGLLLGKWGASVAALVAVLVATNVGFQNVGFKADLLTSVIPNLLASFLAIAAVTERATAVLTEIWFGEQRKQQEERVRVAGKDFNAKRVALEKALNTHEEVIKEAFRSSKPAAMAHAKDIVVGPDNLLAGAREQISNQGKVLETVNVDLAVTESKIDLERLALSFLISLAVSLVGVRVLAPMFAPMPSGCQLAAFKAVDVLLTAGLLAGGTSAITAISDLLGSYMNASRKRAMENG